MICETKAIKGSAKSLIYQANDKGFAVEVGRNGLMGDDPKYWHRQMRAIENQYQRSNFDNKRITQVISLTKEESKEMKTGRDWEALAISHFKKKGIDLKNHAYIMHTHGSTKNPHLHITVSRINFDGKQGIKSQNIGRDFGKISDKIAKERGWKTAKETAELNRTEVARNITEVLQKEKATDYNSFQTSMNERGYHVKLYQSEEKGVYGMRIIPKDDYTETPSPRLAKSGQGYKLSEIEISEGNKAKFKIYDISAELSRNKITAQRQRFNSMSTEEKIKYAKAKNERLFGADPAELRRETLRNLDQAIAKLEPYKNHNPEVYHSVKEIREGVQINALHSKEDLQRVNEMAKNHISNIEAQEQKLQQNRFDQARENREARKEQEQDQNQERNRGFRR